MNACSNCEWWHKRQGLKLDTRGNCTPTGTQAGECRCNPPIPIASNGGGFRAWAITLENEGCGEFDQRMETKEDKPALRKKAG